MYYQRIQEALKEFGLNCERFYNAETIVQMRWRMEGRQYHRIDNSCHTYIREVRLQYSRMKK